MSGAADGARLLLRVIAVVVVVVLYGAVWTSCSLIDRRSCHNQGVDYAGTSAALEGYCSVQGVEVPVDGVRRD